MSEPIIRRREIKNEEEFHGLSNRDFLLSLSLLACFYPVHVRGFFLLLPSFVAPPSPLCLLPAVSAILEAGKADEQTNERTNAPVPCSPACVRVCVGDELKPAGVSRVVAMEIRGKRKCRKKKESA